MACVNKGDPRSMVVLTLAKREMIATGPRTQPTRIPGRKILHSDYLIDNRKRNIEFDAAGALLTALDGKRVNTSRIATPGDPSYGGTAVRVKLTGSNVYDGDSFWILAAPRSCCSRTRSTWPGCRNSRGC
jgi:hypothetical protein